MVSAIWTDAWPSLFDIPPMKQPPADKASHEEIATMRDGLKRMAYVRHVQYREA